MAAQKVVLKTAKDAEYHIERNIYDCDEMKELEKYIDDQVSQKIDYDFDTNLYVLKMYSLYPSKANENIVCKILIKSLMHLPSSDFISLVYLIPIVLENSKQINTILEIGSSLDECDFDKFWDSYNKNKKFLSNYKNFEYEIRKYICSVVACTYQDIKEAFLAELLQMEAKDLPNFLNQADLEWTISKGVVSIPETAANSGEVKKQAVFVSVDQMNNILTSLAS